MLDYVFLLMFLIPAAVLCWRLIVSKSRQHWIRVGAAAAAMMTAVGALLVYDNLTDFQFKDWRSDAGLAAAMTGSVYLLLWSQRKHSNRRHRTISLVAAIVGLVPVAGTVLSTLLLQD
jgi:peptidoglycan/LPS O-acetylase OafA/YrhL